MVTKDKVIEELRKIKEKYPDKIVKIGIFGSVARGDNTEDSDIDVVIEQQYPDLLLLGRIKIELEEELNTPVDIVRLRSNINPLLRDRIEKESIYV